MLPNSRSIISNRYLAFMCLVSLLAGCEKSYEALVSGTVTIDGVPLHTGTVAFQPAAGGAAAYGLIGKDGRYSLRTGTDKGLVVGRYVATVVAMSGPPPGSKNIMDFGTSLIPVHYGDPKKSDLHFTVQSGANHIDIVLHAKQKD